MRETVVAGSVDDAGAGFDTVCDDHRGLHIRGHDTGGETVLGVVRDLERFLDRIKDDQRPDGAEDFHIAGNVGILGDLDDGRSDVCAAAGAADQDLSALLHSLFKLLHDRDRCALADHRTHLGRRIGGVADLNGFKALNKIILETIIDTALYDKALAGAAGLSGIANAAADDLVQSLFIVAVIENDERIIAAKLQRNVAQICRAGLGEGDADLGRAGEAHRVDSRILCGGGADKAAASGHAGDGLGRDTGLKQELRHQNRAARGLAGRHQDNAVAGDKHRGSLVCGKLKGVVERNDVRENTERFMDRERDITDAAGFRIVGEGVAVEGVGCGAVDPEDRSVGVDFGAGLFDRLAAFFAHDFSDLLYIFVFGNDAAVGLQNVQTVVERNLVPFLLAFDGQRDRIVQVFQSRSGNGVDDGAECGIDNIESLSVFRVDKLSVDDHLHDESPSVIKSCLNIRGLQGSW